MTNFILDSSLLFFSLILFVIALFILTMFFLRLWVYRFRPEGIFGFDYHMLEWSLKERRRCYFLSEYVFAEALNWSQIESFLREQIQLSLKSSSSPLRIQCSWDHQRFSFSNSLEITDLIDVVDNDSDFYAIEDPSDREVFFRFYPLKNRISILFDHVCFDGIRFYTEVCQPLFLSRPLSRHVLRRDNYTPIVAEWNQCRLLMRCLKRHFRQRYLPVGLSDDQVIVKHTIAQSEIKLLKKTTNSGFTSALLAHYLHRVFSSLDLQYDSISVGVIIAFSNERFRNNYSIAILRINRSCDLDVLVQEIESQMQDHDRDVLPLYQMLSLTSIQSYLKKNAIDLLFSPCFFYPAKGLSRSIDGCAFYNAPCSNPLYVFAAVYGGSVTYSTTINSPAISLTSFQQGAEQSLKQAEPYRLLPISTSHVESRA